MPVKTKEWKALSNCAYKPGPRNFFFLNFQAGFNYVALEEIVSLWGPEFSLNR